MTDHEWLEKEALLLEPRASAHAQRAVIYASLKSAITRGQESRFGEPTLQELSDAGLNPFAFKLVAEDIHRFFDRAGVGLLRLGFLNIDFVLKKVGPNPKAK